MTTSIDEALLPCPFCGGEAEMIHGAPGSHYVKCQQCGAASDDRFEDSAIAAWNRRSAITSRQAVVPLLWAVGAETPYAAAATSTPFGNYAVWRDSALGWVWKLHWENASHTASPRHDDSMEGAMAAVQSDYSQRINSALAAPVRDEPSRDQRQKVVADWCAAAFGAEHQASVPQRALRMLEEAIEAYQAAPGGSPEVAHKLIDYIFAKEPGELFQELGGLGVTTLALAAAAGLSADTAEQTEVDRVLAKPLEHFWARNKAKNDAGFDATAYPTGGTP